MALTVVNLPNTNVMYSATFFFTTIQLITPTTRTTNIPSPSSTITSSPTTLSSQNTASRLQTTPLPPSLSSESRPSVTIVNKTAPATSVSASATSTSATSASATSANAIPAITTTYLSVQISTNLVLGTTTTTSVSPAIPNSPSSNLNTATIVGIVFGGVIGICIIAFLWFCIRGRKKKGLNENLNSDTHVVTPPDRDPMVTVYEPVHADDLSATAPPSYRSLALRFSDSRDSLIGTSGSSSSSQRSVQLLEEREITIERRQDDTKEGDDESQRSGVMQYQGGGRDPSDHEHQFQGQIPPAYSPVVSLIP